VSCAKTAEPIEMPFEIYTRMGPRNHVLRDDVRCTLSQPGEYQWTVHVRWRCGLLSNYFDHLLFITILYASLSMIYIIIQNTSCSFCWGAVCKTVRPMLSDRCPVCPVCGVGVLWPNGWMDQDETWHAGRPQHGPHCISFPHGKGHSSPSLTLLSKFTGAGFACVRIIRGPCLLWPNGWIDQDEIWYGGRPRLWPHCVRWGIQLPLPKGHSSQFSAPVFVAKRLDGSRCHLVS